MDLPNGPQAPLPIEFFKLAMWPIATLEARKKKFGDTFRVGPENPPLIYFSSPEALKTIFTAGPKQLSSSGIEALKPLIGKSSLILLEGKEHERQRRLLMPPFHGQRIHVYGRQILDIAENFIQNIEAGETIVVRKAMQEITLRVILSALFASKQEQHFEKLVRVTSSLLDSVGNTFGFFLLFYPFLQTDLGSWSPWGKFLRIQKEVDELIYTEINNRRKSRESGQTDILSLLLSAKDETGCPLTDQELRDELITILFAGHESTGSALAWSLYWIDRFPDIRKKLLDELQETREDINPEVIANLPYLNAVCQEALRLYPIVINSTPREVKEPFEVDGYCLPIGTRIMPSIYLAHHREQVFPQPKQFKPERFIENQFSPYEYLPFGGGNRQCLGMSFALYEMKLVLAALLLKPTVEYIYPSPLKPGRRGILLAPPDSFQMKVMSY